MSFKSREKKTEGQGRDQDQPPRSPRHDGGPALPHDCLAHLLMQRVWSSAERRRRVCLPKPAARDLVQALRRRARNRCTHLDALGAQEGEAEEAEGKPSPHVGTMSGVGVSVLLRQPHGFQGRSRIRPGWRSASGASSRMSLGAAAAGPPTEFACTSVPRRCMSRHWSRPLVATVPAGPQPLFPWLCVGASGSRSLRMCWLRVPSDA